MRRTGLKDARRTLQTFTVWILNFQFPFCVAALNVVRWKKPSWGVLLAALAPTVCCVKTIWSRIPSTAYTCFRLGPRPPPHTKGREEEEEWLLVYTCVSAQNPWAAAPTHQFVILPTWWSRCAFVGGCFHAYITGQRQRADFIWKYTDGRADVKRLWGSGSEHWSCTLSLRWRWISLRRTSVSG